VVFTNHLVAVLRKTHGIVVVLALNRGMKEDAASEEYMYIVILVLHRESKKPTRLVGRD